MSKHDRDVRYKKTQCNVARHYNIPEKNWNNCQFDIIKHFPGDPDSTNTLRLKKKGINGMIGWQFNTLWYCFNKTCYIKKTLGVTLLFAHSFICSHAKQTAASVDILRSSRSRSSPIEPQTQPQPPSHSHRACRPWASATTQLQRTPHATFTVHFVFKV